MSRNNMSRNNRTPRRAAWCALLVLLLSGAAGAQNADFNVTVNTGATPPNSDTVYPGQSTSLRITLSNNSTTIPLTGVSFSKPLPTNAINGLLVNGASAINGDAGCSGGTLSTSPGLPGISLAGLTVPARQLGVPGSGECYLDIPIAAYSTNGAATSLSYALNAGEVSSNQGTNATGGPQAITVRAVQRPTWSKSFTPDNVMVIGGAARTLTITLTNPDPNITLTGVSFTDVFPVSGAGGAVIEPTGAAASGTCGGTTALTQGAAAQVAVSNVSLAPGASCTVNVQVRARQNNGVYNRTLTNTIPASGFTSTEGLRPAADATRALQARSPLAVTKDFNPQIVAAGQANTFTIRLTNNGSVALPVTSFTDNPIAAAPYQDRLNIASAGDISNSCAGGTAALLSGGQGFSVSGFSIPANSNCTLTVTYTGQTPANDTPTTYTNNIAEGAVQISVPGIVSQARSATVLVADRVRVSKFRTPAAASPGDPVRYDVRVENFSTTPISNVTVTDVLQNGSTLLLGGAFTPTLSAGCGALGLNGAVQGATSVTFSIGSIPARTPPNSPGACTIGFYAMLGTSATTPTTNAINAGGVCFSTGGPQICTSVPTEPVQVDTLQSLVFAKTFDAQENVSKREGTPARLRLQVSNNSSSALTSLTFSDTLPTAGPFQQLRVANPANIANTCGGSVTAVAGTTSVALNGGLVPAAAGGTAGTCSLSVDVVGPAGVYPNSADSSAIRTNADGSTTPLFQSDGATLTYTDSLQVDKSFLPSTVGPDGRSTASIRFTSLDPSRPITNVAVTDNLPAGMVVATPDNSYSTCQGNPTVSAAPGASTVTLSGATLAPLAVCELRFDVSVTGTSDWVNTIPPGGVTAAGGLTNRTPVSATLQYVPPQEPLISKSINPGTIAPGQSALLTINITNGPQLLTNMQVADYFTLDGVMDSPQNGMSIAGAPEASTNCPGGIVSAVPGGDSVRLSGATLAPDAQCQILVHVTSTTVGTLTNTIPLNSIITDQGATNSSTFAQSTLSTTSSIGVNKLFEPPVVSPTESSRLRITIYNTQPEALTGLSLQDDYPAGLVNAPDPAPFSNCGGAVSITFPTAGSVMLTGGSIAASVDNEAATCYLETSVVAADEGTYLNTIPADSLRANGTPVRHPPTDARLEVRERLVVTKAFDNLTLDANNPAGFTTGVASRLPGVPAPLTIRIENPNTVALTQVNFVDLLPDGLVLAQTPALATTCTDGVVTGVAAGRDLRLTGATLGATGAADAVCTVTANVVSNIPGVYTNEIPAGDVRSFEGINNDPGTQAQIVIATTPGIRKDIAPPVMAPNGNATLTIVIQNENSQPTSLNTALVDNLPATPAQVRVSTPSVVSTTCPGGNGIITAAAGATSVSVAAGSVIPAGGCVVTAQITAPTPGDYLNHIPVGALNTTFGVNSTPAEAPLKVSTLGYISGRVFLDNQAVPNGLYVPGDSTPISGNTIELRSGGTCSGALLASTSTDSGGNYLFSELPAGTYSVCQPTQPPQTLNSITLAGTIVPYAGSTGTPGTASNPNGGTPTSQIASIVLNNNGNANEVSGSPENNFSEVEPASIAGNVYYDANDNGIFDADESGIGGVTVTLSGPVTRTAITAADGSYSFTDLPPGDYTVVQTQPSAWVDGQDAVGTVDGVPRGTLSANDTISSIVLAPGDHGIEYNFGETLPDGAISLNAGVSCERNAVRVAYSIPQFSGPGAGTAPPVTISWFSSNGRLVEQLLNQPPSGELLWPGAVVDGADNGVGWPGWMFIGGEWQEVPDDRIPQLTLRVSIGAFAETTLTYPPSTANCLTQPPGTIEPPVNPPGEQVPVPSMPLGLLWLMTLLLGGTATWTLRQR